VLERNRDEMARERYNCQCVIGKAQDTKMRCEVVIQITELEESNRCCLKTCVVQESTIRRENESDEIEARVRISVHVHVKQSNQDQAPANPQNIFLSQI